MFVIYGRDDCQWCEKAKALLDSKKLEYAFLYVGKDISKEAFRAMMGVGPEDRLTVPQIFSPQGSLIGGYTDLAKIIPENPPEVA